MQAGRPEYHSEDRARSLWVLVFSRDLAEQEVAKIVTTREDVCFRYRIEPQQWLTRAQSEEVKKELFENFKTENAELIQEITERRRVTHRIYRDVRSYYRTWCYNTFGGQEWLWIVIAAGYMDYDLLECMNEALAAKKEDIRQRAAAGGPAWVDAVPAAWADAVTAAPRDRGPVRGGQHHKSSAKLKREAAKRQDGLVKIEQAKFAAGLSYLNRWQMDAMVSTQDRLWYEAESASYAAGVEFADRFGVIRNKKDQDESIVGRAITAYMARVAAKNTTKGWGASASASSRG